MFPTRRVLLENLLMASNLGSCVDRLQENVMPLGIRLLETAATLCFDLIDILRLCPLAMVRL